MRNFKKIICVLLTLVMAFSCFGFSSFADFLEKPEDERAPIGTNGNLSMINFNVNGDDSVESVLYGSAIATYLNGAKYDVVVTQRSYFADELIRPLMTNYQNVVETSSDSLFGGGNGVTSPTETIVECHQTVFTGLAPLGNGLTTYSLREMYNAKTINWTASAGYSTDGNDQKSYKGVTVVTIEIADGYYLDIYNIDADDGTDAASTAARKSQFVQLAEFIKTHSHYDEELNIYEHAVIVTGDFNAMLATDDDENSELLITNFVEPCGLNDAWAVINIAAIDENPADYSEYHSYAANTKNMSYEDAFGHYDSGERFCYANGNGIAITCNSFEYISLSTADFASLSDHKPAVANFSFKIVEKTFEYGNENDDINITQDESPLMKFLNYLASIFRAFGLWLKSLVNLG